MVGTFCTERKGTGKGGLKRTKTQVNKGRVQVIYELLTQVNKGRVQVIYEVLTQVNKDRVQVTCVKLLTQVNKGRVQVIYEVLTQVNKDRVLIVKFKLYNRKAEKQLRKPVSPVGIGNKGRDTAKYQFSSKGA